MKFRRDAATTPAEMVYYQTPATAPSTWRADLARIGIVCGVMFVAGAFATGTAVLLWQSWQTVGAGAWLTGLAIIGYLLWYGWRSHCDVSARQRLDRARINAEIEALAAFDTNQDGKVDASEIDAFIAYVGRIHRPGTPTTAAYAQQQMGIAGPAWTGYKDWLVKNGYADPVRRRGGDGFVLKPSVLRTPWPKLETQLRKRREGGQGDGMKITDFRKAGPIDRVSTLDD